MSKYESYTPDQLEEHFASYLIDSWSYSKVSCFARNEKSFEKQYIYLEPDRRSSSSVAGNAYHAAMEEFFSVMQMTGNTQMPDVVPLEQRAFEYINDKVYPNEWKLQKTTPTVEDCITDASKKAVSLIRNFYGERDLYMEDMDKVIAVEARYEEWLTVNGVDIPLPCHAIIDLVLRLDDGRTVIVDHKGKGTYSDEKEIALVHGKQAITYVLAFEKATGIHVDEVWFIENKYTGNKDGSPQLRKFVITMDPDSRKLYEAMLYEPLRRMIEAVSNPDYIYTVNDSDNLSDKAELYAFWAKTMIAEVDDFNVPDEKKDLIRMRQRKIKDASLAMINPKVITNFKKEAASFITYDLSMTDMTNSEKIEHSMQTFGKSVRVTEISGFSSDTFLLQTAAGVRVRDIRAHRDDIANALDVRNVRIPEDLAIYEGKSYVAVEVSKKRTETLLWDEKYLQGRKLPVGMDNFRNVIYWDLDNHSTPHLLVCGSTGSGKSVELRCLIEYARLAGVGDITVFDPKGEFSDLACGWIKVYDDTEDMYRVMGEMVADMQNRKNTKDRHLTMLVIDEFADIMDSTPADKGGMTMEQLLKMLAQKGRSLGFRIIAATQRASTKVITGDTKVNFPVQICFRMPKAIDSQVVIDEEGAECLQGQGDGLIKSPEYMDSVVRFQGFYKN